MSPALNVSAIGSVQQEQERLEGVDEVTPHDLERFRQALPTDPDTARVVQRAVLRWPLSDTFEYVQGSARQSAYWRVRPPREAPRSAREAAFRERFREAAAATRGTRGTMSRGGEEVPTAAALLGAALEDVDAELDAAVDDREAPASGVRAARRLRALLGIADEG